MTTIDHTKLKAIRADLDKALLDLAKAHGVIFTLGTLLFDANQASGRLTMSAASTEMAAAIDEGVATTPADFKALKAKTDYENHCALYGLKPEWFGKTVLLSGGQFKLVGLLPNKHKNNCLIERISTGKRFICSPEQIKTSLAILG